MASQIDKATIDACLAFISRAKGDYAIQGAILFGSRAKGTHNADSDADMAVLLSASVSMETRLALADIAFDVLLETGVLVSPLPISLSEWEHPETHSNPVLIKNIQEDGVPIFGLV